MAERTSQSGKKTASAALGWQNKHSLPLYLGPRTKGQAPGRAMARYSRTRTLTQDAHEPSNLEPQTSKTAD
eukprot:8074748-Pyramimonas_sp.AAC.1